MDWPWNSVVRDLGLIAALGFLYCVRRLDLRLVREWLRGQEDPDEAETARRQLEETLKLRESVSKVIDDLRQVGGTLSRLVSRVEQLGVGQRDDSEARGTEGKVPKERGFDEGEGGGQPTEKLLLEVANRSWLEGITDRSLLLRMGEEYRLQFLVLQDLDRTFRQPTGQTYCFRPSSAAPEWLGCRGDRGGTLLLLPFDVKFFQAGNSIQVVKNLFHGVGTVPAKFRFRQARKACRLELVPGADSTYKVIERGEIELDPPAAAAFSPPPKPSVPSGPPDEGRQDTSESLLSRILAHLETHQQRVAMALADLASRLTSLETFSQNLISGVGALHQENARLQLKIGELLGSEETMGARSAPPAGERRVEYLGPAPGTERAAEKPSTREREASPRLVMGSAWPASRALGEAKPFSEALRECLVELVQQGGSNLTATGEHAAAQYLRELVDLRSRITRDSRLQGLTIQLVHLQSDATSGVDPSVKLEAAEPELETLSARTGSGQFRGVHLFQFGLALSQQGGDLVAFLISRGAAPSRFPTGFARLMEPAALAAGGQVVRLVEPAILRRQDPMGNLYVVERPLKVELESLGNA